MAEEDGITYFIAGLPDSVTEDDLIQHFGKYGECLKAVAQHDRSDRTKLYGYVTMATDESRDRICTDVHEFGDASLRARLTKETLHAANVKNVHLSNLEPHITEDAIRDAFSQFGAVLDVHTPKRVSTGERMNYGFVTFGDDVCFDAAISAGSVDIDGVLVDIKPSAQTKGEPVKFKGKGKGFMDPRDAGKGGGWGGGEDPDAGIIRDRKGGFKYFVPGLPDEVTTEDLHAHFSEYGHVIDAAVVTERGSDVSRGFGYVTMQDADTRDK